TRSKPSLPVLDCGIRQRQAWRMCASTVGQGMTLRIWAEWAPRVRQVKRADRFAAKTVALGTPVASANQSNMGGQFM
ncbi:hypothetical protein ACJENL_27180, partial [Escherichia coli]